MADKKPEVDVKKALSFTQKPYEVELKSNDTILYALGVGFSQDAMNKDHLRFTYENADSFGAFPTNSVVVCHRGPFADGDFDIPGIPPFNPMQLLHGEETITIEQPLKTDTKYVVQEKIVDLQDKGKGSVLIFDAEIREVATNALQSTVRSSLYVRGLGGYGYKGSVKNPFPAIPKRAPDMSVEEKTTKNQAILYRLCNDRNPLHIDPDMAAMGGFDAPILHGLCTYGITARSVQQHFFKNEPELLKQMNARFTSHVFPGETLVVNAWKENDAIIFATKTKERKQAVCLVGYIKLAAKAKL